VLSMLAAATLGVLLGLAVSVVRERLDRRLRTEDDVPELLALPLLMRLPFSSHASGDRRPLAVKARRLLSGLPARALR
jgi:hypothetical protein